MSTFTSYLLLTRDYSRTLSNLGKTSQVASAAQYYQANIGKVKNVDDLMKDQRLYAYAMKAAGLEDMTYAKAFMKKVLQSDLSDPDSFANKLTDKRYLDFAKAFNFGTDGKVSPVSDIQSDRQELDMIGLYSQRLVEKERAATEKIARYSAAVDGMTSVDDLFLPRNREFLEMAMTGYGLGDRVEYLNAAYYKDILTRGLDDPSNPLYAVTDVSLRDKLSNFVAAFNFAPSGTTAAGSAQTFEQKAATISGFLSYSDASTKSATLRFATDTYRQLIGSVTTSTGLTDNATLYNFVLSAYGLDPTKVDKNDVIAALQSDPNDPAGAANQLGLAYKRMAEDFNFDSAGNIPSGDQIQSADALERTVSRYLAYANDPGLAVPSEFTTYKLTINTAGLIETVSDLVSMLRGVSPDEADPKTISDSRARQTSDFVLKAFGLQLAEGSYSEQFLTDVFSSDLDDPSSFANQLADKRWATMASMFNIDAATGTIPSGNVQSDALMTEMMERYIGQGFGGAHLSQQAKYAFIYETKDVKTVDDFVNSKSALAYALVSFGFSKDQPDKAFWKQILTDPAYAAAQTDPRFAQFADAFNFQSDGTLPSGSAVQTIVDRDTMVENFIAKTTPGSGAQNFRIATDYAAAVANIRSVTQFLDDANATVFNFAMSAFGIDMTRTTKAQIAQVLTSDLNSATSVARQLGGGYLALAQAFNFNTGGVVPTASPTQTSTQLSTTVNAYLSRNNAAAIAEVSGASSTFKSRLASLSSRATLSGRSAVDEFLNDTTLYNYALITHGLDPKTESKAAIRAALTADKSKSFTFLDQLGNAKYRGLADALNFDPDGSIGTPRQAQTTSDGIRLATKYAASYPASTRPDYAKDRPTAQETLITTESDYYATTTLNVTNVDQFVADKRLTGYVLKAFGFAANALSAADVKKILTSDLTDPKSFANASKDLRYREMASMFNFDTKGNTKPLPEFAVQSSGGIYQSYTNYLQQTLEVQQGQSNNGVRLALYFARKASSITSAYSILGDKALFEVARTTLGIPLAAAKADIDVLARTIEKKLNIADMKDPKKVENFIKRFTAMYDIENGGGTSTSSSATTLINGGADIGFSQDMLSSLQTIRFRQF